MRKQITIVDFVRYCMLAPASVVIRVEGERVDGEIRERFLDHKDVLEEMIEQGGSFVAALGEAWRHADADNSARLFMAFESIYREYAISRMQAELNAEAENAKQESEAHHG
jgi:hypothetical protein